MTCSSCHQVTTGVYSMCVHCLIVNELVSSVAAPSRMLALMDVEAAHNLLKG